MPHDKQLSCLNIKGSYSSHKTKPFNHEANYSIVDFAGPIVSGFSQPTLVPMWLRRPTQQQVGCTIQLLPQYLCPWTLGRGLISATTDTHHQQILAPVWL